ncbi:MAG: hypothetical protein ABH879_07040 [archaeon]
MAEDDIYGNKKRFEFFENNLETYLIPPNKDDTPRGRKRKYWIKNQANIQYYRKLFKKFQVRDTSYIRRLRVSRVFLIITHVITKDLAKATREDIDEVIAFGHQVNKSSHSKRPFALDIKFIWKQLFPETDEKGRIDDQIVPYAVRHVSARVDKSRDKLRGDKFSYDEFLKLVQGFGSDPRMQAVLTVSLESLARPQELLGRRIKDVEMYDDYAKIYISEHGKEGTGFLRIIDSYFYFAKWFNQHPLRDDPNAHLFVNVGRVNRYRQMTPFGANKLIRDKCKQLKITKPITLYSLKRNGVTMMRLQGKSDLEIQHTARWTSTKQLRTYDMSSQEDSFRLALIRKGKIKAGNESEEKLAQTKVCVYCQTENGISEVLCSKCQRPLDREQINKAEIEKENKITELQDKMKKLEEMMLKMGMRELQDKVKATG